MTISTVRIAILSDVHAFGKNEGAAPSWINLAEDQANPKINAFAALQELLARDSSIRADILVCGGDLGDKASPEGQQYVWQEVHRLLDPLGAKHILATAGNHDMDSRLIHTKYDARGQIQALEPPFPVAAKDKWMEFWAKNYTIIDIEGVRFVLLNSSAYHGYQDPKGVPEYNHGRVSDRTLDNLIKELSHEPRRAANVLICHHHPLKNDQIKVEDYSEMINGDRLVNGLVDARIGPWLIIHGHKHLPRVIHAPGGNASPTIFSAGSFSAKLYPEYGDRARNEFYILELEVPATPGTTSSVKGAISTWQWTYGNGFQRSRAGHGLGPTAAFGARLDIAEEATKIAMRLKKESSGNSVLWGDLYQENPSLKYLIPDDLNSLLEHLRSDHGFRLLHDENGEISELKVPNHV